MAVSAEAKLPDEVKEAANTFYITCNRFRIPCFVLALAGEPKTGTQYWAAINDNSRANRDDNERYYVNAITPGSLSMNVEDDKIKDMVKVLNGFKVTNSTQTVSMPLDGNDFNVVELMHRHGTSLDDEEDGMLAPVLIDNKKSAGTQEDMDEIESIRQMLKHRTTIIDCLCFDGIISDAKREELKKKEVAEGKADTQPKKKRGRPLKIQ